MCLDTGFCNVSSAAMKWQGTTQNMSSGQKIVVWACSLRKTRNGFGGINSCISCTPIQIFAMGQVQQRNGAKPSKTCVLDQKKWNGHVCCKETRNGSRGINSCIKCASIPVFATCHVPLRNGMESPKT